GEKKFEEERKLSYSHLRNSQTVQFQLQGLLFQKAIIAIVFVEESSETKYGCLFLGSFKLQKSLVNFNLYPSLNNLYLKRKMEKAFMCALEYWENSFYVALLFGGTFLGGFAPCLELCWDKGFRRVICFSDSLQTVTLVKNDVSPYHQFANEIVSIRQLLDRDWSIAVNHTLQKGNVCADILAKMGANSISPFVKFEVPPTELSNILLADALGVLLESSFFF
ncbi:ribonuclease H, partial [Trifolium pratense]